MPSVLAIDAAWTTKKPSGVALLTDQNGVWQCVALAPSYDAFIALTNCAAAVNWNDRPIGSQPDPVALLNACCHLLGGATVDIVTVDMPVATVPITGRRAADNAISVAFSCAGCGTHTPNVQRPGSLGLVLSQGFADAGFALATLQTPVRAARRLIEVYPHPAHLTLTDATYRIPYKVDRSLRYWPGTPVLLRIGNLLCKYATILSALVAQVGNIPLNLPTANQVSKLAVLKRYEDALDALVCGWVGIRYLAGQVDCYGDNSAAIWTPQREA